jgi:hypothetical protein
MQNMEKMKLCAASFLFILEYSLFEKRIAESLYIVENLGKWSGWHNNATDRNIVGSNSCHKLTENGMKNSTIALSKVYIGELLLG